MSDKPIIIELVGPSGSGKTSLMKKLVKSGGFEDLETATWRGLITTNKVKVPLTWLWRLMPVHLAKSLRLVRLVSFYRQELVRNYGHSYEHLLNLITERIIGTSLDASEKAWLSCRLYDAVTDHMLINEPINSSRVILADEFFLQKIHTLFFDQNEQNLHKEPTNTYLDTIPKPAAILNFNIPANVCADRLMSRDGKLPRLSRDRNKTEVEAGLEDSLQTSTYTVGYLKQKYGVLSVEVTNGSNLKEILTTIKHIS